MMETALFIILILTAAVLFRGLGRKFESADLNSSHVARAMRKKRR